MSSFYQHSNSQQQLQNQTHHQENITSKLLPKSIVEQSNIINLRVNNNSNSNSNSISNFSNRKDHFNNNEKETFAYSSSSQSLGHKQSMESFEFDFNENTLSSQQQKQENNQQPVYLLFNAEQQNQNELIVLENHNQQQQQQLNMAINENSSNSNSRQTSKQHSAINTKQSNFSMVGDKSPCSVPTLTNVDEIFYLLSQKIAKYCQILSDLTNCEVFYKAYLPLTSNRFNLDNNSNNNKNNNTKSKQNVSSKIRSHQRSLYWGTHQMLFRFSHEQGIRFDKSAGDSLIKLNQRSISSDVNQLIEEILNAPYPTTCVSDTATFISKGTDNLSSENRIKETSKTTSNDEEFNLIKEIRQVQQEAQNQRNQESELFKSAKSSYNNIKLKDCCIYLNRLNDDLIIEEYFNKFEMKHNNPLNNFIIGDEIVDEPEATATTISLNELPPDSELYSDQYTLNFSRKKVIEDSSEDDNDEEDEDDDEKTLLEKNCLNINNNEINENDENYYKCEQCQTGISYRHLTQLKIHQLRKHMNVSLDDGICHKCGQCRFSSNEEYLKHSIVCYFPNIYQCKTCSQMYENYGQYLFHIRYIHTHVVYMCAICNRKYKHIKDLIDHDQLMHSKSNNCCEICCVSFKNRNFLYEHYKKYHLGLQNQQQKEFNHENDSLKKNDREEIRYEQEIEMNESEAEDEEEGIQKMNIEPAMRKEYMLTLDEEEDFIEDDENTDDEESQENNNANKSANHMTRTNTASKVQKNELIRGLIDRKYQCKWCSLRFYTKTQLKQHEQVHTNTVLNCPVCDKQFTSKDRLNGHMKCHMEPSLECKVCGKKFKRLCNLYNHELVHGLTEHAFMLCQFCGRGFRSRRDYQNHVIANHRDHLMKVDADGSVIDDSTNQNPAVQQRFSKKNSRRPRKTAKKQTPTSDNNTLISNYGQEHQLERIIPVNDSPDETYFTRTGVHFHDLDDFQFEHEEENENEEENDYFEIDNISNNNPANINSLKRMRKSSRPMNRNKFKKLKTFLLTDRADVEEDTNNVIVLNSQTQFTQIQPQVSRQLNNRTISTMNSFHSTRPPTGSILAHLFEESLS